MSFFSENLTILVGKIEGVPGTMETLTSADFDFKVFNPTVAITVEADDEAAKYANGNHGEDVSVMGLQHGTITFSVKLAKNDTVAAPSWAKFAYACGCAPVTYTVEEGEPAVTVTKGWALQPLKSYDEKTITLWLYKIQAGASPKAVCFKYAGCSGKMTLGADGAGKPIMLNFTFSGALKDIDFGVANASIPEVNSLDTTCYERMLNASFSIDGLKRLVDTFSLDTGNEVTMLKSFEETTGIDFFSITKRAPRLTCNPLMQGATGTIKSDYDFLFGSVTGCPTTPTLEIETNNFVLTMPKCQLLTNTPGGRDGRSMFDQTWKLLNNGYTGAVIDSALPYEATWELLQGTRS